MPLLDDGENYRLSNEALALRCGHRSNITCIKHMHKMPPQSVDCALFSPPFPSVFAYTSLQSDLGNSEDFRGDAKLHFSFFFRSLARIMKPGRVVAVHCTQIGRLKRSGEVGLYDFRGLLIRLAQRAGLVYEYDWMIRKDPQAQAIRTRKWELKFQGLERDRAIVRGALADYLIKFRAPGDNQIRIDTKGEVSNQNWIDWAEGCWNNIKATNTLNVKDGRSENDTKHICALQLDLINRVVRLYTNPGEILFSPFAGIGSEGYEALKLGRHFYGCELKPEYFEAAKANLKIADKLDKESIQTSLPFAVA